MSLANPGNSFIVMSREGVGIQYCDSSITKHSVTSSRGRALLCSINYQSEAPSNLRSLTLGNKHTSKLIEESKLGLELLPLDSALDSNNHSDSEGELPLQRDKVSFGDEQKNRLRRSKRIMELKGQSPMPAEGMAHASKLMKESSLGLELNSPEGDNGLNRLRRSKRIMELKGQSPIPAEGMAHASKLMKESSLGLELKSPEQDDGLTKQSIYSILDEGARPNNYSILDEGARQNNDSILDEGARPNNYSIIDEGERPNNDSILDGRARTINDSNKDFILDLRARKYKFQTIALIAAAANTDFILDVRARTYKFQTIASIVAATKNHTILAMIASQIKQTKKPFQDSTSFRKRILQPSLPAMQTFVCEGDDSKPVGGNDTLLATSDEAAIDDYILARTFVRKKPDSKPIGGDDTILAKITEAAIDDFILTRTFVRKGDDNETIDGKSRSEQESEAVEIVVPRINADDIQAMILEQDSEDVEDVTKMVGDLIDYEWDASLPSFLDETEESHTELGGIEIEMDTAEITYKNCVTDTEESSMKCDAILSYTDSRGFKKELYTKGTDDDVLTKRKEDIQSRIFQEPDERKLSISKSGTNFQEDMLKEPVVHENIVSVGVDYELTKYSYDDKRLADGISIA